MKVLRTREYCFTVLSAFLSFAHPFIRMRLKGREPAFKELEHSKSESYILYSNFSVPALKWLLSNSTQARRSCTLKRPIQHICITVSKWSSQTLDSNEWFCRTQILVSEVRKTRVTILNVFTSRNCDDVFLLFKSFTTIYFKNYSIISKLLCVIEDVLFYNFVFWPIDDHFSNVCALIAVKTFV